MRYNLQLVVMGRKKQWSEDMQARFAEGTFSRISSVLMHDEDRTDFIRKAVENELRRREASDKKTKKTDTRTGLRKS